jgi:hypothetical protein
MAKGKTIPKRKNEPKSKKVQLHKKTIKDLSGPADDEVKGGHEPKLPNESLFCPSSPARCNIY